MTLAAVAGPSGVAGADGRPYPVHHVLRGHAALRGQPVRASRSSAPREVQVAAVGDEVWLANLTGAPQQVQVDGPARPTRAEVMDETSLTPQERGLAGNRIELAPYAVARLVT